MKITIDLSKAVSGFRAFLLGLAEQGGGGKPDDDKPAKGHERLRGYAWDESDEFDDSSYVFLPKGMEAEVVFIGEEQLRREPRRLSIRGRELWYGPSKSSFFGTVTIKVIDKSGTMYVDFVEMPPVNLSGKTEHGMYHGRHNNDRPTWYFSKKMKKYPKRLRVIIDGCLNREITHNGHRYDKGGLIVKQSDVSGRGMAVVFSSSCKSKRCRIEY